MKVFFGNGKTIMGKTLLIAVALFSAATAAMAHKVKCFAAADGAKVAGTRGCRAAPVRRGCRSR
jgi:hypothetical protein